MEPLPAQHVFPSVNNGNASQVLSMLSNYQFVERDRVHRHLCLRNYPVSFVNKSLELTS